MSVSKERNPPAAAFKGQRYTVPRVQIESHFKDVHCIPLILFYFTIETVLIIVLHVHCTAGKISVFILFDMVLPRLFKITKKTFYCKIMEW